MITWTAAGGVGVAARRTLAAVINHETQVALAVGAGYLLGRRREPLALAGAAHWQAFPFRLSRPGQARATVFRPAGRRTGLRRHQGPDTGCERQLP
jgi:hypothetical protein